MSGIYAGNAIERKQMENLNNIIKGFMASIALALFILGINILLPNQTQPERVKATEKAIQCPEPTDKGVYFQRGIDENGNALCGFAYYNACPYTEGAELGSPLCDKAKPVELTTPSPTAQPANQCKENQI